MSALLIICLRKITYAFIVTYFPRNPKKGSLSEKNALHADALLIVIVVETVMGTARAPFFIFAVPAVFAAF